MVYCFSVRKFGKPLLIFIHVHEYLIQEAWKVKSRDRFQVDENEGDGGISEKKKEKKKRKREKKQKGYSEDKEQEVEDDVNVNRDSSDDENAGTQNAIAAAGLEDTDEEDVYNDEHDTPMGKKSRKQRALSESEDDFAPTFSSVKADSGRVRDEMEEAFGASDDEVGDNYPQGSDSGNEELERKRRIYDSESE